MASRFRPPRAVPQIRGLTQEQQQELQAWLLTMFGQVAEDLAAVQSDTAPTIIESERIEVSAGSQRRVSPPLTGMVACLEAPSPANSGRTITFIIEKPAGALKVVASPHIGPDGKVAQTLINGAAQATYSLPGVVQFRSNGIDSWKTQAEMPAETVGVVDTSALAASLDATYHVQTANASIPSARVATDSPEIDVDYSSPGVVSWALLPASVSLAKLAVMPDQRALGNDSGADAVPEPVTVHQELDWVGGGSGEFWIFDGVDDNVAIGNVLNFERTDRFTLSFWGDATIDSTTHTGINKTNSAADQRGYRLTINSTNQLQFSVINNAVLGANSLLIGSTATITPGLHHFAATYDGTSAPAGVTLYVDGVAVGMTTLVNTLSATILNTQSLTLGARHDLVNPWRGLLKHASVWDDDLSAAAILEVYNAGTPPDLTALSSASDLVGWWVLDGDDTTGASGITDRSANNNHGTAGGGLAPSATHGSLLARGEAIWQLIPPSTAGLPLCTNGLNAVASFQTLGLTAITPVAAETFIGNFTAGTAAPAARAGSSVAGAGLTYAAGGTLAVGAGTGITVNANDVQLTTIADDTFMANVSGGAAVATGKTFASLAGLGIAYDAAAHELDIDATWAQILAISNNSGANNPNIDAGQFIGFGTEGSLPSNGQIRSAGDLTIQTDVTGSIILNGQNGLDLSAGNSDLAIMSGGSVALTSTGSGDMEFTVGLGGQLTVDCAAGLRLFATGGAGSALFIEEENAAPTVSAGDGAYWVENLTPNRAAFTDDNDDAWGLGYAAVQAIVTNDAATNATTNLSGGSFTIPADSSRAGTVYRNTLAFLYTHTAATTPTLTAEIVIGGSVAQSVVFTPLAFAATFYGEVVAVTTIRTTGASGTCMASLQFKCGIANSLGDALAGGGTTSTTAIDTTAAQTLELRIRMTTAVASNTLTVIQGFTERLR